MKVAIVFHSVCGNDYVIATLFQKHLTTQQHEVRLLRVADTDVQQWQTIFPAAQEYADKMEMLPCATADDLVDADLILLGSPTYFGNMSGEMKTFLDSTACYYTRHPLKGKRAAFFTSASTVGGGGHFCLDALNRFAQHMGISPIPVPLPIQMKSSAMSAYGICHVAGATGEIRPDEQLDMAIGEYCAYWAASVPRS